jgi:hypothetical protein
MPPATGMFPCYYCPMEYRGKSYTIVQGIEPGSWKWTVHLDEKTVKSGDAPSRPAAITSVIWLIDRALKPGHRYPR